MPKIDVATIDDPYRALVNTNHIGRGSALKHICMFCMQTAPSDKFNDLKHKTDCPVPSHEAQTINARQAKPKPKPTVTRPDKHRKTNDA